MNFNGLSVDQAPPIQAPLRFFVTAPLFAILAGILVLLSDPVVLQSRYSLESIAIVHSITIGFFGFVMLGALTQMLPVLAGVKIDNIQKITFYMHLFLMFGLVMLIAAFLTTKDIFYMVAIPFLALGFIVLILLIANSIRGVQNFTPTVKNMAISLFFAFMIVLFGLLLSGDYLFGYLGSWHGVVANIHSVWAIFGFSGILILGVSFQILPMFYVAPHFNKFFLHYVALLISASLLLWLVLNLYNETYAVVAKVSIAFLFLLFGVAIWHKLEHRKRKVSDITIWYWRVASISLVLGSFTWVAESFTDGKYTVLVALFFGLGFIFSIIVGMLYKIIPFLVWFHLNGAGYMSIPTMNEMIDKRLSKLQFFLFLFSFLGFMISFFFMQFLWFFAIVFIISMAILEYNVITCALVYAKIKKTKPDFDMSAFQ